MNKQVYLITLLIFTFGCKHDTSKTLKEDYIWNSKKVTATAYNSVKSQTSGNPNITAFGDTLKPGMKCIAVSRDLLKLGLKHNTPVEIDGLEGVYWVKDKMHSRWKNRIDIYMGLNIKAAKEWGRRPVRISYGLAKY
ncbi:3D domain-containing protein [Cognatitamlana onchidii]|uniref:3D domain-containing protein n=1 Tax=Cognatitamlana onchidii TaxID=2562860 RepID=UPI001F3A01AF|nr:3D domain-containing protein [Algibacter onchidii]